MKNIEERIRTEYQNMRLPEIDISKRVKVRIESKSEGTGGGKAVCPMRLIRKLAVAALFAVIITCTSVTIYAAYSGLTISQIFMLIWGEGVSESIQETISCDAEIVSERNGFDNLEIKPVKVIGDVRGIYLVFELRTDDKNIGRALDTGRTAFYDYNLDYDNSGSSGNTIYILEKTDEAWYIALEYLGGDDGQRVSDTGRIAVTLEDLYRYDEVMDGEPYLEDYDEEKDVDRIISKGKYETVISYDYVSNDIEFVQDDCTFNVSSLTLVLSTDNEETYYEMLDNNLTIELKDGSRVPAEVIYGLEYDGKYTVIYSLNRPVDPADVKECVTGSGN